MDAEEKLRKYTQLVAERKRDNVSWRLGQTCFNVLYYDEIDLAFANEIRGTELDPFYDNGRIPAFLEALERHWDKPIGNWTADTHRTSDGRIVCAHCGCVAVMTNNGRWICGGRCSN